MPTEAAAWLALAPDLILPTDPLDVTAQSLVDPDPLSQGDAAGSSRIGRYGSVVLSVVLSSPTHSQRKMGPIIDALAQPARRSRSCSR